MVMEVAASSSKVVVIKLLPEPPFRLKSPTLVPLGAVKVMTRSLTHVWLIFIVTLTSVIMKLSVTLSVDSAEPPATGMVFGTSVEDLGACACNVPTR